MGITIGAPSSERSRLKLLGTGLGELTGAGAALPMGSFSTSGDIGNSQIIIEAEIEKSLGDQSDDIYICSASTTPLVGVGPLASTAAAVDSPALGVARITKRLKTASEVNVMVTWCNSAGGTVEDMDTSASIDLSAAETIYLASSSLAIGQNMKYRWRAYQEG